MDSAPYIFNNPENYLSDNLQLFVQPMCGDGIWFKAIIQHPKFTMVLKEQFRDLEKAQNECLEFAVRILGS